MTTATVLTRLSSPLLRPQDGLRFAVKHNQYFLGPMLNNGYRYLWQFTTGGLPKDAMAMTPIADPSDEQLLSLLNDD